MKRLSLVLTLPGQHWTGYVRNHFARQLATLRRMARQIGASSLMAFLPGWDGCYYWDRPVSR